MILCVVEGQVKSLQIERDQLLAQNSALSFEIQEQKAQLEVVVKDAILRDKDVQLVYSEREDLEEYI